MLRLFFNSSERERDGNDRYENDDKIEMKLKTKRKQLVKKDKERVHDRKIK